MNHTEQQVRHPVSYGYGAVLFGAGWLLAALLSPDSKVVFITAGSVTLLYGLLSFRNDRITYDEQGITLYSLWGKSFSIGWDKIVCIDVADEPLISKRFVTGQVLRIRCNEQNGQNTYRFPYRYYTGIDAFLAFYQSLSAAAERSDS